MSHSRPRRPDGASIRNMSRHPCIPRDWEPSERATLVYLARGDSVLLIRKLRGHGEGKVNAPGGRIEAGGVGRGVRDSGSRRRGRHSRPGARTARVVALRRPDGKASPWQDMLSFHRTFAAPTARTAEADPFWCRMDEIPYDEMWENDRIWLPRVLRGERIRADFRFCRGRLVAHTVIPDADICV